MTMEKSLATPRGLFLSSRTQGQANTTNPQFATNRISGRHTLYPQDQQFAIGASAKSSAYLFPDICLHKLFAGEVRCSGKLILEQEAWPTRPLHAFRFEVGRELVLCIGLDGNELTDACIFHSMTVKDDGERTVAGA